VGHKSVVSSSVVAAVLEEGYKALLPGLTQTASAPYATAVSMENDRLEELLIKLILLEGATVGLELVFQ